MSVPPCVLMPGTVVIEASINHTFNVEDGADHDGFAKRFAELQQRLDKETGENISPHVVYTRLPVLRLSILGDALHVVFATEQPNLRVDQIPWEKIMLRYAQLLYNQSPFKRFDEHQYGMLLVQHMHRLEQAEHLSARGRLNLQLNTSSSSSSVDHYKRTLEQLRRAEMKIDRLVHDEPGSASDEDGAHSASDDDSQDTSFFSSSGSESDGDALSDDEVPNDLQLDMSHLSDSDSEEVPQLALTTTTVATITHNNNEEDTPMDDTQLFTQWRAHELQCAQNHYTDLRVPHVFAGVLHAEVLLLDSNGVAVLQPHVSQGELLRILYFITEPQRMEDSARRRAVKFLRSSGASPAPLVVCTGSLAAQDYLEQSVLSKEDMRVRSLVLGPRSAALREVALWMHLCHLGEALYLRWLLDGVLPESPWHATLLMYTAQRMATIAMLYGDTSQGGRAAQWMTAHMVGAGMWDDLKAKYNEVSQSLQQKYPAWRQTINDKLQQYAQQATVAMQNAYGTAKEWSAELAQKYEQQFKPWLIQQYGASKQWTAEMAQKYEQQFKPWLKQQYEDKIKPGAINAWNSTREASRNLVKYASQARQYVMQHMQDLVKRIKTDPRYAHLKDKLRALSNEAKQSGVQFWEYVKRQLDEGKLQGNELLEKVRQKIRELKVRLAQGNPPELTQALATATPITTTSISTAPVTPEGDLDMDFIMDYRSYTQNIRQRPRAPLPPPTVSDDTPPAVPPRSFFEPIPESVQQNAYDQLPAQSLFVEPLPMVPEAPPPLPPRDFDEDDMSKHMPTTWQSTPEAASLDAERLSRDLNEAMNQVQWWLSGNDSSYYNPVVVSSTLSLIEQVRDGVPAEMGGGKQHNASNHRNPIYQLMIRGSVQQDDNAHQLRRNQEIQRMVGLANLIMVETSYGVDSSSDGVANDLGAYARTVERLVQQGVLKENDLEDLMAFIEAIEDQQLQLDALRGPFDKSVAAAAEMRVSGRAYAHELYHDQLVNRTRGALFSLADRTEEEVRVTQTIHSDPIACDMHLQKSLYDRESGIARSAIFHARNMVHWNWCDEQLSKDIARVLQMVDEDKESPNVHAALLRWHKQMIARNKAKYSRAYLSDEQRERLLNTAYAFNWLYAAGSMLQLTHEWEGSIQRASLMHTWNLFVHPTLQNVCKEHEESGLYKQDPLQLHMLDQEFYATLRELTRPTGANSTGAIANTYYLNAAQARQELAYFLHRCQPLDVSQLPSTNQWHLLWESITSVQVQAMHPPKQWETPHTPDHHHADPVTYWKKHESLEYDESLSDIVYRLERTSELERRCARAHEFRTRENSFNVATSAESHMTHLQHWMRAQRCWAVRTLRAYPEHFRQYVLLEIECALGPLCQECLIPLPVTKTLRLDTQSGSVTTSTSKVLVSSGSAETWDPTQKISAQRSGDADDVSIAATHNSSMEHDDTEYIKPVAFRAIHIDTEYPTPVSVGAVMLEVHAARSWKEVAHIFASYGLLKHV